MKWDWNLAAGYLYLFAVFAYIGMGFFNILGKSSFFLGFFDFAISLAWLYAARLSLKNYELQKQNEKSLNELFKR